MSLFRDAVQDELEPRIVVDIRADDESRSECALVTLFEETEVPNEIVGVCRIR
jgi:hypothetical protein